jgi:hypothetical protein
MTARIAEGGILFAPVIEQAPRTRRLVSHDTWAHESEYTRALYVESWPGGPRLFVDAHDLARALAEGRADVLVADVPAAFVPCRLRSLPSECARAAFELAPRGPLGPSAYGGLVAALEGWWADHGGLAAYEPDLETGVVMSPAARERVALEAQAAIYDRKNEEFGRTGRWPGSCAPSPLPPLSAPPSGAFAPPGD